MRLLKHILLISLSLGLIILLGFSTISLFIVDVPQTNAGATFLAFSNDPTTGHVGAYGANPVIGFTDPVGTWFRICNGGSCTGYAQSLTQPQAYGGFRWIFDNANNGDLLQAQPQSGTGNAQCNIVISHGYRYCGVGIPDDDGDGVPNVADSCPSQGNIGFGLYANGCPILDSDGDGVGDNVDACPSQGNQGYGVYGNGCPIPPPTNTPILDSDGDGVLDPYDACPSQGNQGYGIDTTGCPFSPPPPPPPPDGDDDGDGIRNSVDQCRDRGDEGFGVASNGCPNPPPPSDTDGDGISNDSDACPDDAGPTVNRGCPYVPDACYVAFLGRTVNLRSGPNTNYPIQTRVGFSTPPILAIGQVANESGEIWYQLEGNNLYVHSDWAKLGQTCDFGNNPPPPPDITFTPTPTETVPTPTPVSVDREQSPESYLATLGCPLEPGEAIDSTTLALIVELPNPCGAKIDILRPQIIIPPIEIAKSYFDDSPQHQRFFDEIMVCNTPLIEWVLQQIGNQDIILSLESLINSMISDENICEMLERWRTTPDNPIPIPPETPIDNAINIGVMLCSHPNMTEGRYNQLRVYLRDVWGIPLNNMVCDEINSANRIGTPTQDQLNLLVKLRECPAELVPHPIRLLEKFITRDNVKLEWLNLSCEELIEQADCENCTPIQLPPELEVCIMNDEDRELMNLFIKNHAETLNSTDLTNLYTAINPCHAVVDYLNTGIIVAPIVIPDPIPTGELTPEPLNTSTPESVTQAPTENPPTQEILVELGFEKPTGNTVQLKTLGVIFIRENQLIIQENGIETIVDEALQGEKFAPIVFTLNNRRLVAYIVVQDGESKIRIVNLNTGDSTYAKLPDIIQPYPQSPLAYTNSLLVFTGIDPNGAYNLYGIPFSTDAQASTSTLLIHNAMNANAVEGLSGFVFEKTESEDNIFLWIPGRQELQPLDANMTGNCHHPVGERFGNKWRFWFLCDSEWGEGILHVRDMQDRTPMMHDIGSYLRQQRAQAIINIQLGELQGELFLSDGESIFLYHQRENQPTVIRFKRGATAIFTFSRE